MLAQAKKCNLSEPRLSSISHGDCLQDVLTQITSELDDVDLIALRLVNHAWRSAASQQLTLLAPCCIPDISAKGHASIGMVEDLFLKVGCF